MDDHDLHKLPELTTVAIGSAAAFVIAVLRGLYDDKEPRFVRVLLEALVCSGISVSAIAMMFFCFPSLAESIDVAVTAGGGVGAFVGFLGVHQLRRLLLKFLNRRIK